MRSLLISLARLEKDRQIWILIGICIVFILLRIPSLIEPEWYGDEGIYRTLGFAISQGSLLYRDVWDNKPPLLYLVYAIWPYSLFVPKFLSLAAGLLSVIVFYLFSSRLFASHISRAISTSFFALIFATPYIEGTIANAENFMLLPVITAFFLVLGSKNSSKTRYVYAGFLLGIAFLLKSVAVFDFAALVFILFLIFSTKSDSITTTLHERKGTFLKILFGFLVPFIGVSFFFLSVGAFPEFLQSAYIQNVEYVEFGNHFIIPQGLILIKTMGLIGALVVIFILRKKISREAIIIYVWLAFSLYSALFSHRPYNHYLLVLLPSFSLLLGYALSNRKTFFFNIGLLYAIWYFIMTIFIPYEKNRAYYKNYLEYVSGQKDTNSYQAFFDGNTPRDYKLANFIRSLDKTDRSVFLWSDSAQIYALANHVPPGRFVTAYHIWPFPERIVETKRMIDTKKPEYIIVTSEKEEIFEMLDFYEQKYTIDNATLYERKP